MKKQTLPAADNRKFFLGIIAEAQKRVGHLEEDLNSHDLYPELARSMSKSFADVEKQIRDGLPFQERLADMLLMWEMVSVFARGKILKAGRSRVRGHNALRKRNSDNTTNAENRRAHLGKYLSKRSSDSKPLTAGTIAKLKEFKKYKADRRTWRRDLDALNAEE